MLMTNINSQSELEIFLSQNKKVVALFYASWCPFCRSFLNIFSKRAQISNSESFVRVQIDDDDNPMWEIFSLQAVPTIIIFENGKLIKRLDCKLGVGLDEELFIKWLQRG
jgi:thioredoxin 1